MTPARRTTVLERMTCALALSAILLPAPGCAVGVEAYYPPGYYEEYPPDAYVATTEPLYWEGNAYYWYGGRWYYRQGDHWNHYDREPPALYQRRLEAPPARRNYEPSWGYQGRASGHSGARPAGHR